MNLNKPAEIHPAIVFNCGYNGLSILQELGSRGIPCFAMDCKRSVGTFTRYAKFKKCPDPLHNESQFIDFLFEFCKSHRLKPVLIPTNDKWAHAISKHKLRLQEVSLPCVVEFDVISKLINKDQFYRIGHNKQYMTPVTWDIEKTDSVKFPVIAKPVFRGISTNTSDTGKFRFLESHRLTLINNHKELSAFLEKAGKYKEHIIIQQFVRGMSDAMYTIGIYADQNSKLKAVFTGKKVRGYPADSGDNVVGESCKVPEILIENTRRIVAEMKYTGIAEFEYKKDDETGEFYLIEINPRAWSWIGITPWCGVNIPLIAYQDMAGIKQTGNPEQNNYHFRYIKVLQDFINCVFRYRKTHPMWSMGVRKWLKQNRSAKKVYAEFHKKDYLIPLVSMVYVAANLLLYKNRTV
ncbi:MAG: ATP-grasp domain-containing protein [Bacteroidales bacterium]|nr:ATP-grasp domain-containing protein [Bacteroidales bacterium]